MIFLHGFFACPLVFAPPITFSRLRVFCSCAGWAHGFVSRIFSMRKIHASKLFRKRGSKQKIHAPPKRKIHAKNSCAESVRQSSSEKGGSKQKIHAPKTKNPCKIHAGIHAPNLCVKVGPKKGLKTQNPCTPQNETNHARIHALILAPPSSEKSIAHATQLCNRKAYANEKGQPYGHVCSTSLSFDPSPYRATFCH